MTLINRSRVKELAQIDERPLSVGTDFLDELEKKTEKMIHDACVRAKANGRNTIMSKDL